MPIVMPKYKNCGKIFNWKNIDKNINNDKNISASITSLCPNLKHICPKGHENNYSPEDYEDLQ